MATSSSMSDHSNVTPTPSEFSRSVSSRSPIVDCDLHTQIPSQEILARHLPTRWAKYLESYGMRTPGSASFIPTKLKRRNARSDSWPPGGGIPGSDLDFTREQHLDPCGIEIAICNPMETISFQDQPFEYAPALTAAINEDVAERWLDCDQRLRASISIAPENAAMAVQEIARCATDRRFVQVLFASRSRRLMGHRSLWPIYEAACAYGLPVALHSGGGGGGGHQFSGAGPSTYYIEDQGSFAQAYQAHVCSLIFEGVFEAFPSLRVVLIEGGYSWARPLAARMDEGWRRYRDEVPHLDALPSVRLARHFWFTTQPIEEAPLGFDYEGFIRKSGLTERLVFASDYPHWDYDTVSSLPRMSSGLRDKIVTSTAASLYGLGTAVSPEA